MTTSHVSWTALLAVVLVAMLTSAGCESNRDQQAYDACRCGHSHIEQGEWDEAVAEFSEAIRLDPNLAGAYLSRGFVWQMKGEFDMAIADYHEAIRLDSEDYVACNNLAWVLATCSEETHRDGERSIHYAKKAGELTNWSEYRVFDTLAAAYAEAGDFDNAVKWQRKAADMADDQQEEERLFRLDLYKAGKPYREQRQHAQSGPVP